MLTILAIIIPLFQVTVDSVEPIQAFPDIPISVLDTWQIPYASDIQDISFDWNSNTLILRSNGEGKIFLADPYSCDSLGEVNLPDGAGGFGVAFCPANPGEYYINSDTAPLILHCDGSGTWSWFSNPAGTSGGGMDFSWFGPEDLFFEVSSATPCEFFGIETDETGFDTYALPGVNEEISGFMGHEVSTLYGYTPWALILTTRFGHEFFFFHKSGGNYTLYGQEPCPITVTESLGLTWCPSDEYVYWSYKGLDQKFYVSRLMIPVFGGGAIEGENYASVLRTGILNLVENPSTGSAGLIVGLLQPGQLSLEVFDLSGRLVGILHNGQLASGESIFDFNGSSGIYTAVLRLSEYEERLRFVLAK
ncbi:MAG: T9SS type A sorting domain-containing protein [Candidatus Sabulitectum sp.]|nr:T9SS type A sorting domain-containing protein [Candidatus Sabulitectum sp.]